MTTLNEFDNLVANDARGPVMRQRATRRPPSAECSHENVYVESYVVMRPNHGYADADFLFCSNCDVEGICLDED